MEARVRVRAERTHMMTEWSDPQRFEACMKQAEMFAKRVYNRQSYQWKVTLGLWALIAAAVNFLWGKKVVAPWWVCLAVLLGYAFFWVRAVAVKNHDDQALEWHFIRESWAVLLSTMHEITQPPQKTPFWSWESLFGFARNWAHWFECMTTAALLAVAYFLLRG